MTCAVAVFNRRGLAFAAAGFNALFPIARSAPAAILALGDAIMDVPWEVVVATYARHLGERTFATLDEYATSFLHYIETSNALFPPKKQAECFRRCVRSIWSDYRDRIVTSGDSLSLILAEDRHDLAIADYLSESTADFGTKVVASYAAELDELEKEIFGDFSLTKRLQAKLRSTVALMYGKNWCHPAEENGIVFAGMGNDEPFPSVLSYAATTVVARKLRKERNRAVRIGADSDAGVTPFGSCETIDTIVHGIHPDLLALSGELRPHVFEYHSAPFMASTARLSPNDLTRMAGALVTLSAIGEPSRLALLTKRDGFTWVERS